MIEANIVEEIKNIVKVGDVLISEPMKKHTSFKVGGPAELLVIPTEKEAVGVIELCRKNNVKTTILGNGSNVLVSDRGIEGVTVILGSHMSDIMVEGNLIRVQAGASMAAVAAAALRAGLTGFEFAGGIPGTIGGGAIMNAGAYGGELKDVLKCITVLTADGQVVSRAVADIEMGYRHSTMMDNGDVILDATFELTAGNVDEIKARMDELRVQRTTKQPLEYPSAGSTFKRPEGYFAGKLIQDAGLAGFSVGDAEVSTKHCGFVINKGNATATDIYELIHQVGDKVYSQFGVKLEPEVRMIGDF